MSKKLPPYLTGGPMIVVPPKPGAKYRCLNCDFQWTTVAGQHACQRCGHLYVKWLNFEEMRERYWRK